MSKPGRAQLGLFMPGELQNREIHATAQDFRRARGPLYRLRGEIDELAESVDIQPGAFSYLALLVFQPKLRGSVQESRERMARFFGVDVRTFDRWRDRLLERGFISHYPVLREVRLITRARRVPLDSFEANGRDHERAHCCSADYSTPKARTLFARLLLVPGMRGVRRVRGAWELLWKTLRENLKRFDTPEVASFRGKTPPHTTGLLSKVVGSADLERGRRLELVDNPRTGPPGKVSAAADRFDWEADHYERARRGMRSALPLGSRRWGGREALRRRWLRIRYIRIVLFHYGALPRAAENPA